MTFKDLLKLRSTAATQLYRLLFNILLLAALLALAQYCPQLGRAITKRGFFCNDEALTYPYHENTVSRTLLYTIGVYVPLLFIICCELLLFLHNNKQRRGSNEVACVSPQIAAKSMQATQLLQQLYRYISIFLLGYACERIFKALCKSTIGRLRPHFFAVCQPQLPDGSTCADQLLPGQFIEHYSCLGGANITASMLRNIHLSFPSGHSSLAFYGMVFLAIYLQQRFYVHRQSVLRLLKPLLQLACLLLAWFVALSRVMDYKHHWSDVLGGALLGSFFAVFVWLTVECSLSGKREPTHCGCVKSLELSEVLAEVKCVPPEHKS